jgi:UDP-glucose 4-epimerase
VDSFDGHVFHIGSGLTYTLNDFADGIRAVIPGADIEVGPGLDPRGLGSRAYYRMDISRARKELGYEPKYDPEAAVRDWVEWTERLELTRDDVN